MKIVKQADQNSNEALRGSKLVLTPRQEELVAELSERLRRNQELDGAPLELNADTMTEVLQEYIRMRKDHESAGEEWRDF